MQIIQSKLLNQFSNLTQGFTTKKNGNLAFHVNDDIKNVLKNHATLAQKLHYDLNSLIHMKQIHSNDVKIITDADNFLNPPTCDAVITDTKNIPLMVMVADCSPIILYDRNRKVIAAIHAGRAGAFKNIIEKTLLKMQQAFDSHSEDIFLSIGASIGPCCYEVGEEISEEAKELSLEFALTKRKNSTYLDISKILTKQLLDLGVKEKHVEFSRECTSCENAKYFSYRFQKVTGRFAGVIMLT